MSLLDVPTLKALGTPPALNFPEAGQLETGVLMYAAVGLMVITLVVNILGAILLNRATVNIRGGQT